MADSRFNVVIIGAGPAGYVCAIRCAQLGMRVACVDQWSNAEGNASPGGTCLNVGCIPSKALLDTSHQYAFMNEHAAEHGITFDKHHIDVRKMLERKNKVVASLTSGVKSLLKKNKVEFYHGTATLNSMHEVAVSNHDQITSLTTDKIIIASGSKPFELDFLPVDQKLIMDSTGALDMDEVPQHLGIIGAGVIGLEMASVWSRLGSKVTIWEASDKFLSLADKQLASQAQKILAKQGIEAQLNSKVLAAEKTDSSVKVTVATESDESIIEVDRLLVAIGRIAQTDGLNLEAVGVNTDERGFIEVDNSWQTNVAGIYAVGDVIGGAMLAHKGSEEGIALAEILAGQHGHTNYDAIPWVIYTWPEIAWAGATEEALKEQGVNYHVGTFPILALGRAKAMGEAEGMIKILADAETDAILGAHIIGPNASELIAEIVVAMEAELSAEDLARTIHGHPTLSEGIHEAALAVDNRAIHF